MLSTFIKLPFVIKIFVLSIFEWSLKTGFTEQCIGGQTMSLICHDLGPHFLCIIVRK